MKFTDDLTDATVLRELGQRIARLRLDRDLTQQQLADEAGVSRHTLLRLEVGESVTLSALIRVLRALELIEGLELLVPELLPSPLEQLKHEGGRRRRASGGGGSGDEREPTSWQWGIR